MEEEEQSVYQQNTNLTTIKAQETGTNNSHQKGYLEMTIGAVCCINTIFTFAV